MHQQQQQPRSYLSATVTEAHKSPFMLVPGSKPPHMHNKSAINDLTSILPQSCDHSRSQTNLLHNTTGRLSAHIPPTSPTTNGGLREPVNLDMQVDRRLQQTSQQTGGRKTVLLSPSRSHADLSVSTPPNNAATIGVRSSAIDPNKPLQQKLQEYKQ